MEGDLQIYFRRFFMKIDDIVMVLFIKPLLYPLYQINKYKEGVYIWNTKCFMYKNK